MDDVSVAYAKEHLEELLVRATRGEDVRISDPAIGAVRLAAVATPKPKGPRTPGRLQGKIEVPEGLLDPMTEEELKDWYGADDEAPP